MMTKVKYYFKLFWEGIRIIRLYKNWFDIFSNHFKKNKYTTELVLRNGIKYDIHPRSADMGTIQEIYSDNIYRIRKGDISNNSVVIDIGAQIGVFSVLAAAQADNVTVYSIEPEPNNFQLLLRNIKINHLEGKIHPINQAVFDTNTPRKLIKSTSSSTTHSLFPGKFTDEATEEVAVDCITLEDIFERYKLEHCDVLKLDCEGAEYNILLNTPDKILARIGKVVAEYHDGLTEYTHQDLEVFLKERGFKVETISNRSFTGFTVGFLYAFKKLPKQADNGHQGRGFSA